MARKKKQEEAIERDIDYSKIVENIKDQKVTDVLRSNFMPYSMSVIISRALVEIDGLKPSHRKVLYTMYLMGLLNGARSKSANISGQVLKLNPHSDSAAYETMVRLTDDNETLLAPLVDSKGNLGKHYSRDMAFSASRYCVTGDTLIATDNGLIRIQDIYPGSDNDSEQEIDIKVKSLNVVNSASKFFNSGKHPTLKIVLENGMQITGTHNHPIMVANEKEEMEWKLLEDIKPGNLCVVDLNTENGVYGTNADLIEARFLGSMVASGVCLSGKGVGVKDKNRDILMPVYAHLKSYYPDAPIELTYNENRKTYEVNLEEKEYLMDFISLYNFHTDAKKRFIPRRVLSGTKEYQRLFLQYLFEKKSEIGAGKRITFIYPSKLLIQQLQVLLATNFGIMSTIVQDDKHKQTKLVIYADYIKKFRDEIGFLSEANNKKLIPKDLENDPKYNCPDVKYAFIPVKTKNNAGEKVVYSVKVDSDCHSFSANGFINHNTEAKLSKISEEFFKGINKDSVDFVDNYDSTMKEPTLLPVTFPNILANPSQGIAVGMASNICSFNLKELCDATILHIKKPKADLLEVMPGPDFTTGAYLLYEDDVMRQVYNTGKGSIKLRAKYKVDRKNNIIEILEIPYTTTVEAIIEGVIDLIKKGKIKEINDIRDEIDKDGFKIAIDYKRTCDPDVLMKKLFKMTKLQDSFGCNFNILIDGHPKTIGVYEILDEWVKWRQKCVSREYAFDLRKKERELHMLRGLEKILLNINKVIKIIRDTVNEADVIPNLMASFKLDEEQANYIADIKLRNLNKEYLTNRTKDITKIEEEIERLKGIIGNEKEINKIIVKTLTEVSKKYAKPRKTEIIPYEADDTSIEEIVEDYSLKLYRTKDGYVKKLPLTSLKNSPELKLKESDEIIQEFQTTNKTEILFFTNKCNVYKTMNYNIKDCKPSEFGEYANNMLDMDGDEEVLYMCPIDFGDNVIIGFENGKVAKFPLNSYETKNNRKKLINAFFGKSKVLNIFVIKEDEMFGMTNSKGKLLIFNSKDIPLKTSKITQGIQVIRLPKDATATSFKKMEDFGLSSSSGYGYRSLPAAGGNF